MGRIDLFLASVADAPWAILPSRGRAILSVLARRARGARASRGDSAKVRRDREAYAARRDGAARASGGGIAVLPVYGVLVHRAHQVDNVSGGGVVAYEQIATAFRAALADPAVGTIVLDIDSPGGSVYGCDELAALIAASEKPVVAVANALAASGAYWIASQADEVIVTPSGQVGSIGVIVVHEDVSKALAEEGVAPTEIVAGKNKNEGTPFAPLSDEARATLQGMVDRYYEAFTKAVARGRGVTPSVARGERFGEGRVFGAKDAVDRGMADRVATLDETLQRLAAGGRVKRREGARAEAAQEIVVLIDGPAAAPQMHVHMREVSRDADWVTRVPDGPPQPGADCAACADPIAAEASSDKAPEPTPLDDPDVIARALDLA